MPAVVIPPSTNAFLAGPQLPPGGRWRPVSRCPASAPTLYLDALAGVMTLVVTGVGFLIHVYAVGYMDEEGDDDYSRFFAHMNLFVFSMLLLVLAHNFVFLVIGWALVGVSSYLLIGLDHERPSAVAAARKAFVMNVIGDVGIVIASLSSPSRPSTPSTSAPCCRARFGAVWGPGFDAFAHSGHAGQRSSDRLLPPRRGGGEVGPDPAPHLASRCHGRSDPGLGP